MAETPGAPPEPSPESPSGAPESPGAPFGSLAYWGATLAAVAALFGLALVAAPQLALDPLLAYAVAFVVVSGQTVLVADAVPRPDRRLLLLLLPALAVLLAVYVTRAQGAAAACAVSVALLGAGTLVGGLVGSRIEHPGHLLFAALISSGVDALSVLHPRGVSHAIAESEVALSVLAMSFPLLGSEIVGPILGVGDVAFAALYLGAARAHGLPLPRTRVALMAGLLLTGVVVAVTALPIPALPLMGLFVVLSHPAARRPRPADLRAGLTGVALLCALGVVLYLRR